VFIKEFDSTYLDEHARDHHFGNLVIDLAACIVPRSTQECDRLVLCGIRPEKQVGWVGRFGDVDNYICFTNVFQEFKKIAVAQQ